MLTKRATDTRENGKCCCPSISFGRVQAVADESLQKIVQGGPNIVTEIPALKESE
jgi:hypothetical protein